MKKYSIAIAVLFALLIPQLASAEHFELDIYGLSYHLVGEGYRDAPRGLDENAAWVFNPGIGITYDWRENYEDEGLSPLAMAGYFQDCDDRAFVFGGGGGRYRHKLADDLLFDLNFGIVYSYAQDWWESKYYGVIMPIGNIGFSTPFWGRWWSYRITYAPENTGISATSGGDLLFMNISVQL